MYGQVPLAWRLTVVQTFMHAPYVQVLECPNPDSCTYDAREDSLREIQAVTWWAVKWMQGNASQRASMNTLAVRLTAATRSPHRVHTCRCSALCLPVFVHPHTHHAPSFCRCGWPTYITVMGHHG